VADGVSMSIWMWFAVFAMMFRAGENCRLSKYLRVASLRNMEVKHAGQIESIKSLKSI